MTSSVFEFPHWSIFLPGSPAARHLFAGEAPAPHNPHATMLFMPKSRRQFLALTSLSVLGAAAAFRGQAQNPSDLPPGAPPAFGTGPAVGPEVSPTTFAEAEKLVRI